MCDTVGEHDAAAHAVPEHDQRPPRMLAARDLHQLSVIGDELRHLPHPHPLATGSSVPPVIQGVHGQTGIAEPLRDVVVAAGVFAVPVCQHDHAAHIAGGRPHVVDDPYPTDAAERPLLALSRHPGEGNGRVPRACDTVASARSPRCDFC